MNNNNLDKVIGTEQWGNVFNGYIKNYPLENNYLNVDGIINKTVWNNAQNPKILFYLKEAYRGEKNIKKNDDVFLVNELLSDWDRPYGMWLNVNTWVNTIREKYCGLASIDNTLSTIAFANIIKTFSHDDVNPAVEYIGNKTTKLAKVRARFKLDATLLRAQYKAIAPNILVWCAGSGTIHFLPALLEIDSMNTAYDCHSTPTNALTVYAPKADNSHLPVVFHSYHPASFSRKTKDEDFANAIAWLKTR